MAITSAREYLSGDHTVTSNAGRDFAAEAHRLGQAVGRTHLDLSDVLGMQLVGRDQAAVMVRDMHDRFDEAADDVTDLRRFDSAMRARFDSALDDTTSLRLQRVHGGLHLGTVFRTSAGWVLSDFGAVPKSTLAERDVAAMLYSFHEATAAALAENPNAQALSARALEWVQRCRTAFFRGYAEIAGDRYHQSALLVALELELAVSKVASTYRHRPEWTIVPLSAISQILTGRSLL